MKKLSTILIIMVLSLTGCTSTSSDDDLLNNDTSYENSNSEDSDDSDDISTSATIYTIDSNAESLITKDYAMAELDSDMLFEILKSEGFIPTNCTLNSFVIEDDIGVLDLSSEIYNANVGSGTEGLMLDSLANTYLFNYDIDMFKLLVDGEVYESGHILLGEDDYFILED